MKTGMNLLLWTDFVTEKHFPLMAQMKAAGFDGIEIPLFSGDAAHYRRIAQEVKNLGLICNGVTICTQENSPISPDSAVRRKANDHHRWAIEMVATLGGELLCGPYHSAIGVFSGEGPNNDERKRAAEVLRQAAEVAQQHKITLAIEYLNRFECYFVTTAAQTKALIDDVKHPSFRCMYDTFHAHIEEKNPASAIQTLRHDLVQVHISENDRGVPGTGMVRWQETFQALRNIKFEGWLTIESFGRALPPLAAATKIWRDLFKSPEDVYLQGRRFIMEQWKPA